MERWVGSLEYQAYALLFGVRRERGDVRIPARIDFWWGFARRNCHGALERGNAVGGSGSLATFGSEPIHAAVG